MIRRVGLWAVAAFAVGLANAQAADVLVFGGSRGTGLEAVKVLVARKDKVTVLVRPASDVTELKALDVKLVTGDVLEPNDVKKAFAASKFSAAVDTVGGGAKGKSADFDGVKNIADAAKAAGVKRIVLVSAIGVADSSDMTPERMKKVLENVLIEKGKGEAYLTASGLDYTVIRPGGLRNGPATGKAYFTEDHHTTSLIRRADLGKLVADSIGDKKTHRKILHAIDPTVTEDPKP